MKIALINGSPKVKENASGVLLGDLRECFPAETEVVEVGMHTAAVSRDAVETLKGADAWVFSYPIYVDGVPGHLLACLVELEKEPVRERNVRVYGIANCGFYEGIQTELALKVLENWSAKAGYSWGGGLGVGGGGGILMMPEGARTPVKKALQVLAGTILKQEDKEAREPRDPQGAQELQDAQGPQGAQKPQGTQKPASNQYVSVACPRFLYKFSAQMGWRQMIKQNGGQAKDLGKTKNLM